MIIIGGLGTVTGSILGAMFITLLPEVLRLVTGSLGHTFPALVHLFASLKLGVFGLTIVLFHLEPMEWRHAGDASRPTGPTVFGSTLLNSRPTTRGAPSVLTLTSWASFTRSALSTAWRVALVVSLAKETPTPTLSPVRSLTQAICASVPLPSANSSRHSTVPMTWHVRASASSRASTAPWPSPSSDAPLTSACTRTRSPARLSSVPLWTGSLRSEIFALEQLADGLGRELAAVALRLTLHDLREIDLQPARQCDSESVFLSTCRTPPFPD